jgi:hypothetical protein
VCPFFREEVASKAELHYKTILKAKVPKAQKDVSIEVYLSFLTQRFPNQPLNMLLKLIPVEKTATGKLLISQGIELGEKRGEKRGKKLGEKRGKKLGENQATAKVLLHLATAKWPKIKPAARKRIQALPAAKSMRLIAKLAKLATLEDFCAQLVK